MLAEKKTFDWNAKEKKAIPTNVIVDDHDDILDSMTEEQLIAHALEKNISLGNATTKEGYIKKIKAAQ